MSSDAAIEAGPTMIAPESRISAIALLKNRPIQRRRMRSVCVCRYGFEPAGMRSGNPERARGGGVTAALVGAQRSRQSRSTVGCLSISLSHASRRSGESLAMGAAAEAAGGAVRATGAAATTTGAAGGISCGTAAAEGTIGGAATFAKDTTDGSGGAGGGSTTAGTDTAGGVVATGIEAAGVEGATG